MPYINGGFTVQLPGPRQVLHGIDGDFGTADGFKIGHGALCEIAPGTDDCPGGLDSVMK